MMNYLINPAVYASAFTVPGDVVDRHLKLCSEIQLKVLLYVLRHLNEGIREDTAAEALGIPPCDAADALLYWAQNGILNATEPVLPTVQPEPEKEVVLKAAKPSREDVARRGLEDERVRFLFQEAQQRFGRSLKSNESSVLLWLYDDEGMDISVILLLLQYAKSQEKMNIGFVEKTAALWLKNGVHTVADAEDEIAKMARRNTAWGSVERIFGLERHKPSPNELALADSWLNAWKMEPELLQRAYYICVDKNSAFSMKFVKSILEKWHEKGFTTVEQVENEEKKPQKGNKGSGQNYAAYDLAAYEKMLNSDD